MYKLFVSLRYLRSRASSYIAIGALAIGIGLLVVVLSVMGGFQREFQAKIRGTSADVTVESGFFFGVRSGDRIEERALEVPGVVAAAPFVENIVLVNHWRTKDYGMLQGIVPAKEAKASKLRDYILSPRELLEESIPKEERVLWQKQIDAASAEKPSIERVFATGTDLPGIVVGIELFRDFKMKVGDELELLTATDLKKYYEKTFVVVGAVKTGIYERDRRHMYAPLEDVQTFLHKEGRLSGVAVKLDDFRRARELSPRIAERLGPELVEEENLRVIPWDEKNKTIMTAVEIEKWMISVIIIVLIGLIMINLLATLTTNVVEKRKDLGILAAVGATKRGVMSIFVAQGILIGVFGTTIGLVLGLPVAYKANEIADLIEALTGYHPFPKNVYYLDKIPIEVDLPAILAIGGLAVFLGFLFSLYAAYRAARLDPVEALRYE